LVGDLTLLPKKQQEDVSRRENPTRERATQLKKGNNPGKKTDLIYSQVPTARVKAGQKTWQKNEKEKVGGKKKACQELGKHHW